MASTQVPHLRKVTTVDDLIAFLRARLDEDEQAAQEALHADAVSPGVWTTEHHNSSTHSEPNRCHIAEDRSGNYWSVAHEVYIPNAEHMACWDPARVLAEVEAKRQILDEVVPEIDGMDERINGEWGIGPIAEDDYASVPLLKLLGLPYAGHPDYRQEWRP